MSFSWSAKRRELRSAESRSDVAPNAQAEASLGQGLVRSVVSYWTERNGTERSVVSYWTSRRRAALSPQRRRVSIRCRAKRAKADANLGQGYILWSWALSFILFRLRTMIDHRREKEERSAPTPSSWNDQVGTKNSAICSKHLAAEDFVRMYSFMPGQDKPVIPRL